MAEISDPQVVDFANNSLRLLADQFAHIDSVLTSVLAQYNARDLGTIINKAGAVNLIADGSSADGRTRRSGGDIFNIVTLFQDFQAFMTSGRQDVINGWQVNGVRL